MLFNSIPFLLLVLPTFVLYYLPLMRGFQLHLIIISSFIFYAYNDPALLTLLLVSISINIAASYAEVFGPHQHRRS